MPPPDRNALLCCNYFIVNDFVEAIIVADQLSKLIGWHKVQTGTVKVEPPLLVVVRNNATSSTDLSNRAV